MIPGTASPAIAVCKKLSECADIGAFQERKKISNCLPDLQQAVTTKQCSMMVSSRRNERRRPAQEAAPRLTIGPPERRAAEAVDQRKSAD
jgi:hypothetical protein